MADCKTCEYEKICEMPDFVRNDLKRCKVYEEKKPQTNADRIRAMSDEELAEFLQTTVAELGDNLFKCSDYFHKSTLCNNGACGTCGVYLQWLKSEVKEEA